MLISDAFFRTPPILPTLTFLWQNSEKPEKLNPLPSPVTKEGRGSTIIYFIILIFLKVKRLSLSTLYMKNIESHLQ